MDKGAALKRAEKHIFSTGLGDIGSSLCRANMKYGLAKFHYAQKELGMEPNATFISGPDETISRNRERWQNGVGYGAKIAWGPGKEKATILDVMPNACGMLVGVIEEIPKPKELIEGVHRLMKESVTIDDVEVKWDFGKSNHFIDIYNADPGSKYKPGKHVVVMHAGCGEFKEDNVHGSGLYWHKSTTLRHTAKEIETPFGPCHVVLDSDATDYLNLFKRADKFAHKKREYVAKELFGKFRKICHHTHQGMLNYNEIGLGTNPVKAGELYPIALRAELPAYLFRGKRSFSDKAIIDLGFKERGEELGVMKRLKNANILPHGGGYIFEEFLKVENVFEVDHSRFFEVKLQNDIGKEVIANLEHLEYRYRGEEVVTRSEELGLGEPVTKLMPNYVLKI